MANFSPFTESKTSLSNVLDALWIIRFPLLAGGNRDYFWSCVNSNYCSLYSFRVVFFLDFSNFLTHVLIIFQLKTWRGSLQFSWILCLCRFLLFSTLLANVSHFATLDFQFHYLCSERPPGLPCIEGYEVYIYFLMHIQLSTFLC